MGVVRRPDNGFTLLEVLVAFLIAAPALALLFSQGLASVSVSKASAAYQEAIARATSRLASLSDRGLVAGERGGDDGGGFRWRTRVSPVVSSTVLRWPAPRGPYAAGTTLYDVTVEVSWPGGSGARAVRLSTRRLGATEGGGP